MLSATVAEETPLTKQINGLTRQILVLAGFALAASILLGIARGVPVQELFLTAVAFMIAAIPTALPAIDTAILSKGSQLLASAGAIVKQLRSVETLGSTSALNSDKTGTLTMNQMTAVQMAIVGRRYAISGTGYSTEGQDHPGRRPARAQARALPAADGPLLGRRDQGRRPHRRPERGRRSSSSRPRAASTPT